MLQSWFDQWFSIDIEKLDVKYGRALFIQMEQSLNLSKAYGISGLHSHAWLGKFFMLKIYYETQYAEKVGEPIDPKILRILFEDFKKMVVQDRKQLAGG